MKHDQLRNIAHNLADSLACGCFIIGYASINMAAEADANTNGKIVVDFLTGEIVGVATPELRKVMVCFAEAVPGFCVKNGVEVLDFTALTAEYSAECSSLMCEITIVDQMGRSTTDQYVGIPLKRPKILDARGRVRPMRGISN